MDREFGGQGWTNSSKLLAGFVKTTGQLGIDPPFLPVVVGAGGQHFDPGLQTLEVAAGNLGLAQGESNHSKVVVYVGHT